MHESTAREDVRQWAEAATALYADASTGNDLGDERKAGEAVANLMSGCGAFLDTPREVTDLAITLLEAGYLAALCDVRDGKHPDL